MLTGSVSMITLLGGILTVLPFEAKMEINCTGSAGDISRGILEVAVVFAAQSGQRKTTDHCIMF